MNILILGGTQLTGPWIVRSLYDQGHKLTVFNRGQTKADLPSAINRIFGNRRQLLEHKSELQKLAPDVVIDMNAMMQSDAQQLIDVFANVTNRLVVISSCDVYFAHEVLCQPGCKRYEAIPLQENAKLRSQRYPYRHYAKNAEDVYYFYDKGLVEAIINQAAVNSTILRFPFVYGPGDYTRVLPYLKYMQADHSEIFIEKNKAKWASTRGYSENIAMAVVNAALDQRNGKFTYNVGEVTALTEKAWAEKIASLQNWQGVIVEVEKTALPVNLQEPFNWQQAMVCDSRKIRHELQYKETFSLDVALTKTIAWTLQNMPA